jgi:hypothetical protein
MCDLNILGTCMEASVLFFKLGYDVPIAQPLRVIEIPEDEVGAYGAPHSDNPNEIVDLC